ncbi:hypothetical protein EG832_22765 [bacterium]|nr:hypothetical protein [bacterium]
MAKDSKLIQEAPPKRHRIWAILIIALIGAVILSSFVFTSSFASDCSHILDTYWDIHDQVLYTTEAGRHYIDLFWTHASEIGDIIMSDPEITREALSIVLLFEPSLRALADGKGDQVIVTEEMVTRVNAFLLTLELLAGPELSTTIQTERARTPFEPLIGTTFEEARLLLVGLPQYPLPEPLPTRFP